MTTAPAAPYRLTVLGARDLRSPDGGRVSSVLAQPKRLCLLTYLALAGEPVPRSALAALFWPESDETRARNALSQAVFYLRRSMSKDVVRATEGDRIFVSPEVVWCDAGALLATDTPEPSLLTAAERDVLEGWNADDSQPLQEWLDSLRRDVRQHAGAITVSQRPTPADEATKVEARAGSGDPGPPRHGPGSSDGGAPPPREGARASAWLRIAVFLGLLVIATLAWTLRGARSEPAVVTIVTVDTLVVLAPGVEAGDGAPSVPEVPIRTELLAALSTLGNVVVVPAFYEHEAVEFRRQRDVIGQGAGRAWLVETSLRITEGEMRMTAILHGSGNVVRRSTSDTIEFTSADDLIMTAPEEVARSVLEMVGEAVASDRAARGLPVVRNPAGRE